MKKSPGIVWLFSVLVLFGLLYEIVNIINGLFNLDGRVQVLTLVVSIIFLLPSVLFIYGFFNLRKDCLPWLHTAYIIKLIGIIYLFSSGGDLVVVALSFVVLVIIWWAIWDYVKNKKIGKKFLIK